MKTYPVFLIGLDRRRSVVIGGGREAQRKVDDLLACEAAVTVVAAEVTVALERRAAQGELEWRRRDYRTGDLAGAFLVISTADDPELNRRVWREAESAGVLCNVMDDVDHCNFIAGSVARSGELAVAISTGGAAPALAVRLRQRLERELGPEYGRFLELAAELRAPLLRRHADFETRRALWYALVDSEVLDLLRDGRDDLARDRARRRMLYNPAPCPPRH